MGRIGAGHRAAITRRNNVMKRQMAELRAQYDSAGKRQVRALLHAVARESGVVSVLEFLGGGEGAEAWVAEGFQTTVAENRPDRKALLAWLAAQVGYKPFAGRASRLKTKYDLIFADFDGPLADGGSEPELHRLATMTTKWLAVTVSPDRQVDPNLQAGKRRAKARGSRYADATMAARLVAVTGFRLVYLRRYQRNELGQWMWFALLQPGRQRLDIGDIQRRMTSRGFWAWRASLVASTAEHKAEVRSILWSEYYRRVGPEYRARRAAIRHANPSEVARRKREYRTAHHEAQLAQQRAYAAANPEKIKAWHQAYRERHRERVRAASAAYKLRKKGPAPGETEPALAA